MQIRELSKPITSQALNESLAKTFGYKINLENFTDVQLEDARNKLRTKISQFELEESFNSIGESPEYQKTRMFLDVVNQEIFEREEGKCPTCDCNPCECKHKEQDHKEDKKEKAKVDEAKKEEITKKLKADKMKEKAKEHAVPESWINSAISRMELGESDEEELAAELTTRYDLSEDAANYVVYLAEGEADKAATIMSTKDMVDKITGWLEDVATLKAEHLLELLDSIRETQGSDVAQQYNDAVKPALESIYAALEQSRQGLQGALSIVSGGQAPETMGAPTPDMGSAPAPELGAPDLGAEPGTEEPTETPPEGTAGRAKRESVDYSRRLGMLLASKKN